MGQNRPDDGDGAAALHYADDDAVLMAQLLEQAGVRVTLLARYDDDTHKHHRADRRPDGLPTKAALRQAVVDARSHLAAARAAGSVTELYFVFSGHGGAHSGAGYLVFEDGPVTRDDVFAHFLNTPLADVSHIIIDACKSYYAVYPKGQKRERAPSFLKEPPRSAGVVLSTSSDQDSHESDSFQGGVFSFEVRAALRGAADVDVDGVVSYAELGAFLDKANEGIAREKYRPEPWVRPPPATGATTALLSWPIDVEVDTLAFDDDVDGAVSVEDENGDGVLAVNPARGFHPSARVPASRPLYVRSAAGERTIHAAGSASLKALTPDVGIKGDPVRGVFVVPFGPADVVAWRAPAPPADPPDPWAAVAVSSTAIAAAGLLVASTATALALDVRDTGRDAANAEKRRRNDAIAALNVTTGAAVVVVAAGVATTIGALTWRHFDDD